MNTQQQAILDWVKKNRSADVEQFEVLLKAEGPALLLHIGFETGREFQHHNPTSKIGEPVT